MSGTAITARTVAVSPLLGQARLRSVSARSASVRGAPSSRVSLAKIANIDLSRGSAPSRALSIPSRTRCWLTGKLTPADCPGKTRRNPPAITGPRGHIRPGHPRNDSG